MRLGRLHFSLALAVTALGGAPCLRAQLPVVIEGPPLSHYVALVARQLAEFDQLVQQYEERIDRSGSGRRYRLFLEASWRYVFEPQWQGPQSGSGMADLWTLLSAQQTMRGHTAVRADAGELEPRPRKERP